MMKYPLKEVVFVAAADLSLGRGPVKTKDVLDRIALLTSQDYSASAIHTILLRLAEDGYLLRSENGFSVHSSHLAEFWEKRLFFVEWLEQLKEAK
jgi:predicted transcriptional regulator